MEKPLPPGFQERVGRLEALIAGIEAAGDDALRGQARELVRALLELHAAGLGRMLEAAAGSADREAILGRLLGDDLVSNLLLLHGLHPVGLEARVRRALDAVRPRLAQHGGSVELLGVAPDGRVTLRLEGNCHGCPSSRVTLKYSIEEAIYAAAPDVTALEVEGEPGAPGAPEKLEANPKFTACPLPGEAGAEPKKEKIA